MAFIPFTSQDQLQLEEKKRRELLGAEIPTRERADNLAWISNKDIEPTSPFSKEESILRKLRMKSLPGVPSYRHDFHSWTSADDMQDRRATQQTVGTYTSFSEGVTDAEHHDVYASFPFVAIISKEDWEEKVDLEFLDDIALVSSDDDEIDFKKREMSLDEYESKFFKLFHDSLRKNKLILNSQLPQFESQGIMSIFKSQGAHVRQVAKLLQKCRKAANRLFNFQCCSFIICTESVEGKSGEELEMNVNDHPMKFLFEVDRFSTIDSLCMFDFSAICSSDSKFFASTSTSPYLSLDSQQWRSALKEDRVGREIMMYEPSAVELLKKQGNTAQMHARELERTHYFSKLLKLVISEYVYLSRQVLTNNMSFKGSEVIRKLKEQKKNRDLFKAIPKWVTEFEQLEFILNPAKSIKWADLISDEDPFAAGDRARSLRKTIFLCDPIHWTLYMMILVDMRVQALISLLAGTAKVNKGWEESVSGTDTAAKIRDIKTLGKEHLARLRNMLTPLPKRERLETYAATNQTNYFVEGINLAVPMMSLCLATNMMSMRSESLGGKLSLNTHTLEKHASGSIRTGGNHESLLMSGTS